MSRSTFFALLSLPLLTACAGNLGGPSPQPGMSPSYSKSAGFTGVGFSAADVFDENATRVEQSARARAAAQATPAVSGGIRPADKVIRSRATILSVKAVAAIQGSTARGITSTPVNVANQQLNMSIIDVGDTRFAVLRKPRGTSRSLSKTTKGAFLSQVSALTGCASLNEGFDYGPNKASPLAVIVPLRCS